MWRSRSLPGYYSLHFHPHFILLCNQHCLTWPFIVIRLVLYNRFPCIRDCLCALWFLEERFPNHDSCPVVSLYRSLSRPQWARRLFLARLLDALLPSVHGALATSLLGHFLASLLICDIVSMCLSPSASCPRLQVQCLTRLSRSGEVYKVGRGENAPACCLALKATSSSSRSWAGFFLGFLLWMGLVPAAYGQHTSLSGFAMQRATQAVAVEGHSPPCPEGILDICWQV